MWFFFLNFLPKSDQNAGLTPCVCDFFQYLLQKCCVYCKYFFNKFKQKCLVIFSIFVKNLKKCWIYPFVVILSIFYIKMLDLPLVVFFFNSDPKFDKNARLNPCDFLKNKIRQKCWTWGLEIKFVETYSYLENYVTSEGAVSHNILYYQPLPITRKVLC